MRNPLIFEVLIKDNFIPIMCNHYMSQINSLPFNGYEMVCFVLHLYWIILHFSWQYLLARQSLAFFCFSNVCTQLPPMLQTSKDHVQPTNKFEVQFLHVHSHHTVCLTLWIKVITTSFQHFLLCISLFSRVISPWSQG